MTNCCHSAIDTARIFNEGDLLDIWGVLKRLPNISAVTRVARCEVSSLLKNRLRQTLFQSMFSSLEPHDFHSLSWQKYLSKSFVDECPRMNPATLFIVPWHLSLCFFSHCLLSPQLTPCLHVMTEHRLTQESQLLVILFLRSWLPHLV